MKRNSSEVSLRSADTNDFSGCVDSKDDEEETFTQEQIESKTNSQRPESAFNPSRYLWATTHVETKRLGKVSVEKVLVEKEFSIFDIPTIEFKREKSEIRFKSHLRSKQVTEKLTSSKAPKKSRERFKNFNQYDYLTSAKSTKRIRAGKSLIEDVAIERDFSIFDVPFNMEYKRQRKNQVCDPRRSTSKRNIPRDEVTDGSASNPQEKRVRRRKFCYCKRNFADVMIRCDLCKDWFHWRCCEWNQDILNSSLARALRFICDNCLRIGSLFPLPFELIKDVLSRLEFQELLNIASLNSNTRSLLLGKSQLVKAWEVVNIGSLPPQIREYMDDTILEKIVRDTLQFCHSQTVVLSIQSCPNVAGKNLHKLISELPNLNILDIRRCDQLSLNTLSLALLSSKSSSLDMIYCDGVSNISDRKANFPALESACRLLEIHLDVNPCNLCGNATSLSFSCGLCSTIICKICWIGLYSKDFAEWWYRPCDICQIWRCPDCSVYANCDICNYWICENCSLDSPSKYKKKMCKECYQYTEANVIPNQGFISIEYYN